VRSSIKQSTLNDSPYELWNAYVELLAMTDYDRLSVEQRPAHLVFWYDSEVNNGGHLQYFENKGIVNLDETIESLGKLGAEKHREILIRAKKLFLSKNRKPIESVQEFVDEALEGEYEELDNEFYEIEPDLSELLQRHLKENTDLFVEIIEDI